MTSHQTIEVGKKQFINSQIMYLVFQSSLLRGHPIFTKENTSKQKSAVRKYLTEKLHKISIKYDDTDYDGLFAIITEFYIGASKEVSTIAPGSLFTFGRAQKCINMYLKYIWVLNLGKNTHEPPHCPIDSIILNKIGWKGPSWTHPTFNIDNYRKAIQMCQKEAGKIGTASWELAVWNNTAQ